MPYKNKDDRNEHHRRWMCNYKGKARKFLDEYKRDRGCCYCQEREPCCLDFHHRDPTKKKFKIGEGYRCNRDKKMKEIEKCILVCANCHRKLHKGFLIYRKVG